MLFWFFDEAQCIQDFLWYRVHIYWSQWPLQCFPERAVALLIERFIQLDCLGSQQLQWASCVSSISLQASKWRDTHEHPAETANLQVHPVTPFMCLNHSLRKPFDPEFDIYQSSKNRTADLRASFGSPESSYVVEFNPSHFALLVKIESEHYVRDLGLLLIKCLHDYINFIIT